MKTALLLCFSTTTLIQQIWSAPVDSTTARIAATNFYNWKVECSVDVNYAQLVYIQQVIPKDTSIQTVPFNAYYVFNFGNHFVMISADTRIFPILAYSTESAFNIKEVPENLSSFLDEYVHEIKIIVHDITDEDSESTANEWNLWISGDIPMMATNSEVGPLIQTKWKQSSPYNSMCPVDANGSGGHAITGCGACAMAQIMRYWQYPSSGTGSNSYTPSNNNYGTQSVNFAETTYNYSLMPISLNNYSPQAQINEVAKLMYHCGVSVDMDYGPDASSTTNSKVVTALRTYFGFGNTVSLINKLSYSSSNWISLIKNELNSLRPVFYSGQGSAGGHAFVCDGYNNMNQLHFNWGWGGSYDGYYTVSNLNPGDYNFSSLNSAIIGIDALQPNFQISSRALSFITETSTASQSRSVSIHTAHYNDSILATVTGNFEISINDSDFYTTQNIGNTGGELFVRYQPTVSYGSEHGYVVLTSGNIVDTIFLKGTIYNGSSYCLPPESLNISSQDMHNISLQWETPEIDPDPHVLTWSSYPSYSLGYNGDYTRTMLQRYCDTDLVNYHNQALTSISFYALPSATVYKAVVYKGGNTNGGYNPGTLVLMQDIDLNSLNYNAWNTVVLDTPFIVNTTQELWFGIYVEAPGGNRCMSLSTQSVPTKSCILGTYSSSGAITCVEYSRNYSFCLRGTVENIQTITNFEVSRDSSVIGTTAGNSFQDYLNDSNTHTYTVTANWNNSCSVFAQKSYTNIAQISATPEVLTFFTNYGFNQSIKKCSVSGNGLTETITALVSDHFLISTDSVNFSSLITLPISGGNLFVKYIPSTNDTEYETGSITLTSGNHSATIELFGQCFAECNPPQNLVISNSGNITNLSWNEPANQVIQQEELTWYESNANTYYGATYAINQYLVYRFDTTDISSYNGKRLTAISFYPHASATRYKIVVYQGGCLNGSYYLYSGTQLVEQDVDISSLSMNTWNTIPLDEPIIIDASQELWYGIYIESPAGTYPIRMSYPYVSKKGAITKTATATNYYWYELDSDDFCLSLKANIEDNPISLTHYKIDRNEENLDETEDTYYNDNIIYNGNYKYNVWAVWSNGCRAPLHGTVTVSGLCDPQGDTYTETACNYYDWHDTTYTESGSYYYLYYDTDDCPLSDTLNLTIHYSSHNIETETACESFTWHGQTYTQSGTYTYSYSNENECANTDTLHLTINYGTHNVETETACESFTWHGQTYIQSGTYTYSYNNENGCASTDTLHLTINYGTHNVETETACENFTWHGQTYTQSGTYIYSYNNENGCASTDTLHLIINPSYNIYIYDTVIRYHEYTFDGHDISTNDLGSFSFNFQYFTIEGCDSIIHLELLVLNNDGIPTNQIPNIIVFPNPAQDLLYIKGEGIRQVFIYNTDGKIVYSTTDNNLFNLKKVNISRYASGEYLIKVILADKRTITKRVIFKT